MIPIYKPYINKYKELSIKALEEEWISNYGMYIKLASNELCHITGNKYCVLTNNGTSATHCLFLSLKYKYPSIKKIYVPNNVFISPWNCALTEYDKNILEVMKMNSETLNIDTSEEYIQSLQKSCEKEGQVVVLIVHNLGNIINVPRLKRLRPDLIFVEDNCEGLFGKYENKYSGTESLCSSVSFYANKSITTGEGGAFLTNDLELYNYIFSVHSHGMSEERYIHNTIAYNYRMTNVQAGLLYSQLKDIDHILFKKRQVFEIYDTLLNELIQQNKVVKLINEVSTIQANWLYTFIIPNLNYKKLEMFMESNNIQIRPCFYDIRVHKHLKDIRTDYDELEITKCIIMIPSYPELDLIQQDYIITCLKEYLINNK